MKQWSPQTNFKVLYEGGYGYKCITIVQYEERSVFLMLWNQNKNLIESFNKDILFIV